MLQLTKITATTPQCCFQ